MRRWNGWGDEANTYPLPDSAASRSVTAHVGTIPHQHGVGMDHASYLALEKGPLGMRTLDSVRSTFDPDGIMNPGNCWRSRWA